MKLLIKQLSAYGWNKRTFTDEDFHYFCQINGVIVFEGTRGFPGEYFIRRDLPIILIHPKLTGLIKTWVAFHELAHHWLHVPSAFGYSLKTKEDIQADAIATPMLIPKRLLREPGLFALWEQGYPPSLLERRKLIFERYGF
jgi:Zn-dependent peptidase ImmA (M78 family)